MLWCWGRGGGPPERQSRGQARDWVPPCLLQQIRVMSWHVLQVLNPVLPRVPTSCLSIQGHRGDSTSAVLNRMVPPASGPGLELVVVESQADPPASLCISGVAGSVGGWGGEISPRCHQASLGLPEESCSGICM